MQDDALDARGLFDDPLDVDADEARDHDGAAPLPADRFLYPRVPRLTAAAEADLARRIANGDADAEARLVEAHVYLALAVARRHLGRGVPLADLVQEGALGLVVAARRWHPTGEARFATYAQHWVTARIRRAIARTSLVLSASAERRRARVAGARARLSHALGRDPSEAELARVTGLSLRQLRTPRPTVVRLEDAVGDRNDDATLADFVEARGPAPVDGVERLAAARQLHGAMGQARLTERERAVLWLRYGLDDEAPRTLRDVGAVLGITHASQLLGHERAALRKLRAVLLGEAGPAVRAASGTR